MPTAFDPVDHVVRRLREQRLRWVDLGDGKQVQVLLLRETELFRLVREPLVDIVISQTVGWKGFSEAALFGAHDGAADELPFRANLWDAVARDSIDYVEKVGALLRDHAEELMAKRADAKKA